jgi:PKD repeat protein
MKRIYVTLLMLFAIQFSKAQCPGCVIDQGCTISPPAPALCPAVLPDGLLNTPYDENVTFYMPAQFTTSGVNVTLNQITVSGITGMPQGLNWQTSASPSNIFYPASNPPVTERGCVKICGTPTVFGQFNIIVSVVAEVTTPFGNITQNETFSLPININSPPGANASFSYNPSFGCSPLDVTFEGLIVANGLEQVTYNWNFNNGNTSNLQIPPMQTYAVPDTYFVSLTTKKFAYRLSQVSVTTTGTNWCGDVEEPNFPFIGCTSSPDIYFELTNNGATQTSGTIDDQNSPNFTGLTYILTAPLISLQFYDEDLISGNDNLGVYLFSVTNPGTFNISNSELTGTMTIDTVFSQQFTDIDTVIVYPVPTIPLINTSGAVSFCQGDSVTLSVAANNSTFQWYLNDTTLLIGDVQPDLTIVNSGAYSVVETNEFGCSRNSANQQVTVFPIPASPNLFVNGGSINSSAAGNIQWFFNGDSIPGATQPNLLYADSGLYTIVVTNTDGCINSSSLQITTPSGIYQINRSEVFLVYPNPASDVLYIKGNSRSLEAINILITDISGAVVYHEQQVLTNNQAKVVNISELSNGVYFISLLSNTSRQTQKISVLR